MRSIIICLFIFCQPAIKSYSQVRYPSDSIPGLLRIGTDAVVRTSQTKMIYVNNRKAYIEKKIAYTLLNSNAEELINVSIPYDKYSRISRINANAYDETGKLVWVLNKPEIYDVNAFSGPVYIDDSRMKLFRFPSLSYPYTIEYSYREEFENLLLDPVNYFQSGSRISVEKSGIQVVVPKDTPFRFSRVNMKSPTDSMQVNGKLILTWQEENIPARKQKDFAPKLNRSLPSLYFTTDRFTLESYEGDLSTWNSCGISNYKFIEGRDVLDDENAEKVRELVGNTGSRREKIRKLYEYMQSKTRYFYVGYGIGGYQPVPAETVAKNGYGDCKALSNYMKALLKAAGIESFYTLVKAGIEEDINPDFPSDQFNHVILCVPDDRDTIWLECTDQTAPFGYLGSFTSDRHVLVLTPEGGKLQRTPSYGSDYNRINSRSEITLYGSGDADVRMKLVESGLFYDGLKAMSDSREDSRKKEIAGLLDYSTFNLKKEEYSFGKTDVPYGIAKFDIHIRDLASKSEKRIFISPGLISNFRHINHKPTEIELPTSYQENDTVRITIPLGYKTEYLPEDLKVDSRFGRYSSQVSSDGKFIYYNRNFEINKGNYRKDIYQEFYDFMNRIAKNDHAMVILRSNEK